MDLRQVAARNMRMLREGQGLTQTQVADMAYVSLSTYNNMERGEGDSSISKYDRVAKVLGVSTAVLFSDSNTILGKMRETLAAQDHCIVALLAITGERFGIPGELKTMIDIARETASKLCGIDNRNIL